MKRKRLIITVLLLTAVNTTVSLYLMNTMKHTEVLLKEQVKEAMAHEGTLYSIPSLDRTMALLQKRATDQPELHEKSSRFDPLKLTGDILHLFKKNNIIIEKYQIQGEEDKKELFIQGKGTMADITTLIYTLSFSKTGFRIIFLSAGTGENEISARLVMRITYA